jgi:alkylated DNA repair dioxygenase AlkB
VSLPLFVDLPDGFAYRDAFVTVDEERDLLVQMERVHFSNFEMRGVVARRRVAFFEESSYAAAERSADPIPPFLEPLRLRVAEWARVAPDAFAMALINEYRTGAPIGWHRDAPQYGIVAGVSLGAPCRMKFRPYVAPSVLEKAADRVPRKTTHELTLAPRSGYLMTGPSRQAFEHSIPAVEGLRYSITFRTLR